MEKGLSLSEQGKRSLGWLQHSLAVLSLHAIHCREWRAETGSRVVFAKQQPRFFVKQWASGLKPPSVSMAMGIKKWLASKWPSFSFLTLFFTLCWQGCYMRVPACLGNLASGLPMAFCRGQWVSSGRASLLWWLTYNFQFSLVTLHYCI